MNYGIRNKITGQVEQIVEKKKAEAQKMCRALNQGDSPEPPMQEGERVQYEVVRLDRDGNPVKD